MSASLSHAADLAPNRDDARNRRAVGLWLAASALMVFAMMIIGAITRLTESGLSMVEWRPLIGTLPPLRTQNGRGSSTSIARPRSTS